jgi:hypothetical protein
LVAIVGCRPSDDAGFDEPVGLDSDEWFAVDPVFVTRDRALRDGADRDLEIARRGRTSTPLSISSNLT